MQRYGRVLRRQWWVVLLVTVVAIGAAIAYVARAKPVYSASMKIVVGQGQTLFAPGLSVNVQPYTQTITDLLQSQVVAQQTINQLGLKMTPSQLLGKLGVSSSPDTAVLSVSYDDSSKRGAVTTLGALGSTFTTLVNDVLAKKAATSSGQAQQVSVVVFDPAHADPGQVSPRVTRTLVIAAVLGLVAGILLAFLRDAISSKIRTEEEAEAAYEQHVVGALPRGMLRLPPAQVAALPRRRGARVSEAVKMMTARVCYTAGLERGVVVVIGAQPEDGKTTVSAHLAVSLAESGAEVIAVEADLHRPALHSLFGVEAGHDGLREVVVAEEPINRALVSVAANGTAEAAPIDIPSVRRRRAVVPAGSDPETLEDSGSIDELPRGVSGAPRRAGRLRFLAAGTGNDNPLNVLSLTNAASLIAQLRAMSDFVVVDTPPLLLSGDSYPLVQLADAVIVVCREQATKIDEARRVRTILKSLGVTKFSVVLSESASSGRESYYAYADSDRS